MAYSAASGGTPSRFRSLLLTYAAMGKRYTRVHRLLRLIALIQSSRDMTAPKLAKLCEIHERTIFRDIDTLNAAGIPCSFDEEAGGYRIAPGFYMPPVDLTAEEALAIVGLIEHCSQPANIPFMRTAARAVEKIRSQLPAKVLDALAPLDKRIHIGLARGMADDSPHQVYEQMRRAIATKRALRCRYDSNKHNGASNGDPDKPFVFKPYALWYCQRAWYVVGQRSDRDEPRQLKLNRFTSVAPTDKPYFIPDDFDLASSLGNAWRMMRGQPRYDIAIRFQQPFAETVTETRWHSTQEEEWSDDHQSVTLRFNVDGLDEIVWWVLGYGPGAEVVEPKDLRDRVHDLLKQAASVYDKKSTSSPRRR